MPLQQPRLQGPTEGLISSPEDDATLVHFTNHMVDGIQATLLPPIWTKEHSREPVAMEVGKGTNKHTERFALALYLSHSTKAVVAAVVLGGT